MRATSAAKIAAGLRDRETLFRRAWTILRRAVYLGVEQIFGLVEGRRVHF